MFFANETKKHSENRTLVLEQLSPLATQQTVKAYLIDSGFAPQVEAVNMLAKGRESVAFILFRSRRGCLAAFKIEQPTVAPPRSLIGPRGFIKVALRGESDDFRKWVPAEDLPKKTAKELTRPAESKAPAAPPSAAWTDRFQLCYTLLYDGACNHEGCAKLHEGHIFDDMLVVIEAQKNAKSFDVRAGKGSIPPCVHYSTTGHCEFRSECGYYHSDEIYHEYNKITKNGNSQERTKLLQRLHKARFLTMKVPLPSHIQLDPSDLAEISARSSAPPPPPAVIDLSAQEFPSLGTAAPKAKKGPAKSPTPSANGNEHSTPSAPKAAPSTWADVSKPASSASPPPPPPPPPPPAEPTVPEPPVPAPAAPAAVATESKKSKKKKSKQNKEQTAAEPEPTSTPQPPSSEPPQQQQPTQPAAPPPQRPNLAPLVTTPAPSPSTPQPQQQQQQQRPPTSPFAMFDPYGFASAQQAAALATHPLLYQHLAASTNALAQLGLAGLAREYSPFGDSSAAAAFSRAVQPMSPNSYRQPDFSGHEPLSDYAQTAFPSQPFSQSPLFTSTWGSSADSWSQASPKYSALNAIWGLSPSTMTPTTTAGQPQTTALSSSLRPPSQSAEQPSSSPPEQGRPAAERGPMSNWTKWDVSNWVAELGLPQHCGIFVDNEIDGQTLPTLSVQDMVLLKIPMGHCKKIEKAIKETM